MAKDKIMPQHNDTANCTLQVENITLIFRNVTSYDLNVNNVNFIIISTLSKVNTKLTNESRRSLVSGKIILYI